MTPKIKAAPDTKIGAANEGRIGESRPMQFSPGLSLVQGAASATSKVSFDGARIDVGADFPHVRLGTGQRVYLDELEKTDLFRLIELYRKARLRRDAPMGAMWHA